MQTEHQSLKTCVREGYQILLCANAELDLPMESEKLCRFYQELCETCMTWASEVHGEQLRNSFLSITELREKSRFRTQQYRLCIRCVWEARGHAAFLCESWLLGQPTAPSNSYHRMAQVWNLREETVLPFSQIFGLFGEVWRKKRVPFFPDGIYPMGEELVLFRNARGAEPFLEERYLLKRGVYPQNEK